MSEVRQWVELDPTNGAGAAKPQETAQDSAPDAAKDGGKDAPAPAPSNVEGGV